VALRGAGERYRACTSGGREPSKSPQNRTGDHNGRSMTQQDTASLPPASAMSSSAPGPPGSLRDRIRTAFPWLLFAIAIGVFGGVAGFELLTGFARGSVVDVVEGAIIFAIGLPVMVYALILVRERTKVLTDLRAAETRLRDMVEASSDWLWETGPDLRFTLFSGHIPGQEADMSEFVIGKTRFEIGDQTVDAEVWARHADDLAHRRPFRDFVYRQLLPDGSARWRKVSGRPYWSSDGRFLGYRGSASDVTEQKEAALALAQALGDARQSEAKFRSLVANVPGAVYRTSPDDARTVLYVSEPIAAITGYHAGTHLADSGPGWIHLIHPDDRDVVNRVVNDAIAAQKAYALEYRIVHRDGSVRWVFDRGQTIVGGDGRAISCEGFLLDITDQRAAEADLREAKDQAESASRAKSDFLAIMSHELRTPLNAIIGFAEILEDEVLGPIGNDRYRDYAEDIRTSGKHLLSLINDILDLSKAEAGAMELYEEPVDIAGIIESSIAMVRPRTEKAEITIAVDIAPILPLVRADERKLRQSVLNILSNSVKYSAVGGQIRISASSNDRGLCIRITDSGIGIASADIPKAMSPFGQIDSPLNRRTMGTGLGLPLAKRILEVHGGRFEITSEYGKGTTVSMEIPTHRLIQPAG